MRGAAPHAQKKERVYQNAIFFRCRDVACRVLMFATTYKTFNINNLSNQIVETQNFASLLLHWNDNFDTPSTASMS